MSDIYGVEDYVERARQSLERSDIREENKYYLNWFIDELMADNDVGEKKIFRYVQSLRILEEQGAADFCWESVEKQELKRTVGRVNMNRVRGKTYAPESRAEIKKPIRKLMKYREGEESPDIIDFISVHVKKKDRSRVDPTSLPTPKTVVEMVKEAKNLRDKALVLLLWESGARIGEFLTLNWEDLVDQGGYYSVQLDGKTGKRPVPVVDCYPVVEALKQQENPSRGDEPVFTSLQSENRLSYSAANDALERMAERTGTTRKYNPHAFRKSRATFMAHNGANVFQLMRMFGWEKVETAKQYIEVVRREVESLVVEVSGRSEIIEQEVDDSLDMGFQQWEESPVEDLSMHQFSQGVA